ncbi:hypothetical protein CARUB_v10024231mg [Capsella rubella]|uniref:Uncharacterized protein n=1 Tax=Capsella rubella TaxID=81985 RepID=R0HVF8_9BRAS|nr:uncharacterized protein LOC17888118 [Capsella rubella]EOA28053.1 hypothetical protein CARUB_v10024231mg [Capsella rubella]
MSERTKVLDKQVKDKINDCLERLREIQAIEIRMQPYCGLELRLTAASTCDVDLWLQRWKITRGRDLEYYTCLLGTLGQACSTMKVATRIIAIRALHLIFEYKGIKPPPPVVNADPSQLQALHEEHLQDEFDLLEDLLLKIRVKHRLLTRLCRSTVV